MWSYSSYIWKNEKNIPCLSVRRYPCATPESSLHSSPERDLGGKIRPPGSDTPFSFSQGVIWLASSGVTSREVNSEKRAGSQYCASSAAWESNQARPSFSRWSWRHEAQLTLKKKTIYSPKSTQLKLIPRAYRPKLESMMIVTTWPRFIIIINLISVLPSCTTKMSGATNDERLSSSSLLLLFSGINVFKNWN